MTTSTVTLVGDVSDLIGNDYDPSRTKVWVQHNTDKVVTDSGPIRLGAATKAVASDGTFSFANVVASTSLVENLQATLWVDWPNTAGPERTRRQVSFGPYDLTGLSGTVDIRTLEETQALDPVASSALLSEMQDLRDEQVAISGIDSTDTAVAYAVQHGATTPGVLSASYVSLAPASPGAVQTIGGRVKVGSGSIPSSLYLGGIGPAQHGVAGTFDAYMATPGEHRLINNWDGNNTFSVKNLSNNDGYSAARFLDYQGKEGMAVGYGNPGTIANLPFAGAAYLETSTAVSPDDGSAASFTIPPHAMRFVTSGYLTADAPIGLKGSGVYARMELSTNGDVSFFDLNSQFSLAKKVVKIKPTGTLQLGETTGLSGGVPPQVKLDAVGTVLAGSGTDAGRPSNFSQSGSDFAFATYHGAAQQLRLVRPGVVKVDVKLDSSPTRWTFSDPDHGIDPLTISLDGNANFGLFGYAGGFGGGRFLMGLLDTNVAPSSNPVGGGLLFSQAGALKWRGSAGTVTTVAAA